MNVKELVQSLFKHFMPELEIEAEKIIDTKADPFIDSFFALVEGNLKIKIANDALEAMKPQAKIEVKKFLHSLADKYESQAG